MSRFADPKASGRLTLDGTCDCPGTPHDEDWIELRTQLGTADVITVSAGNSLDTLELLILDWNLLDADGEPAPVDREHINRLFSDSFDQLDKWVEKNVIVRALPNASGAHSGNGSRASARSIPGNRTRR